MTTTRLKFCGLTREQDVDQAVALGADMLGFIHVPASPRHLPVTRLRSLLERVPSNRKRVIVVQDAALAHLETLRAQLDFNFFQFHGGEPEDYGARFGGFHVAHLSPEASAPPEQPPAGDFYLLDTKVPGQRGGTGRTFDWTILPQAPGRFLVAGGLNPDNISHLIRTYQPWGVDVSSGIEAKPGIKDHAKMAALIQNMRSAQSV